MSDHNVAAADRPLPATCAEAIGRLSEVPGLSPSRRREIWTAAKRLTRATGRQPSQIAFAIPALRDALNAAHPARIGISGKAWANTITAMRALTAAFGLSKAPDREAPIADAAWAAVVASVPHNAQRAIVAGFGRFCCARGVAPDAVTPAALDEYEQHLEKSSLHLHPRRSKQYARLVWNRCARTIPAWPGPLLPAPASARVVIMPRSAFPASFVRELDGYLAAATAPPGLDGPGRTRALSQASARDAAHRLRYAASLLVREGRPIHEFTTLADLLTPAHLRTVLLTMRAASSRPDQWSQNHRAMAYVFLDAARHFANAPPEVIAELETIRGRVGYAADGLSDRARRLLLPFHDPRLVARLFALPQTWFEQADRELRAGRETRAAEWHEAAVGFALLLTLPMRPRALATIDAAAHLHRDPRGRIVRLHVPGAHVKNGIDLDAPIERDLARRLAKHFEHHRPRLTDAARSTHLFPGPGGRPRNRRTLCSAISRRVTAALGVPFTVTLIRHIAALLAQADGPGGLAVAQRLLAHTDISTTGRMYGGLSTRGAHAEWARIAERAARRMNPKKENDDE